MEKTNVERTNMSVANNDESPFDLLILGDVVTPDKVLRDGYIAIRHDRIVAVGSGEPPAAKTVERYENSYLFPGLIDAQIHAGSFEGVKGIEDATRAAAAGGVTVVVDMPFDNPEPVNTVARLESKIAEVNRLACVDVALYVTLSKEADAADAIEGFAKAGAAGIKLSTYEYHPVRFPRFSTAEMYAAFVAAQKVDLPVGFHNEDQELVDYFTSKQTAAGNNTASAQLTGRPPICELVADAQILELASGTDARCHIVHSSLARGCDIARHYRDAGNRVTVESCVHYLVFNNDDVLKHGALLKLNPSIRLEEEREALWVSLFKGDIDFISTDHVAWPIERKSDPAFFSNASGIAGLESLLALLYTGMARREALDPLLIAKLTAENPARHFGLYPNRGRISSGALADVTVFRREKRSIDPARMSSKFKYTPYAGMEMDGYVSATYLRGKKVYEDGKVIATPGTGCFVRPDAPQSR